MLSQLISFSVSTSDTEKCSLTSEEEIVSSPSKNLPRKALTDKTIVLDMDLTLLCTIGDGCDLSRILRMNYKPVYDALTKRGIIVPTILTQFGGSGKAAHNDVIKRPGVEEFLIFCKTVFKNVILWSAGQANYVYETVKMVLDPANVGIFDHVYTANDIVQYSSTRAVFTAKPLEKIMQVFPDATLARTIIVDDLQCNFIPNPQNGVLIPSFSPQLTQIIATATAAPLDNMADDHYLFSLLHFLADSDFLNSKDVRDYNLKFFSEKF